MKGFTDDQSQQVGHYLADLQWEEYGNDEEESNLPETEHFVTECGPINAIDCIKQLSHQSLMHKLMVQNGKNEQFVAHVKYGRSVFQGIMPDSGAAGVSTVGESQFHALKALQPEIELDITRAAEYLIRFEKGDTRTLGTVNVNTPIGVITFHVVNAFTPFLFCLEDMKRLGVNVDVLNDCLIQGEKKVPLVYKFGHLFMMLDVKGDNHDYIEQFVTYLETFLTEKELRQVHRRFGHPSVRKLSQILKRSGNEVRQSDIEDLTKVCHQCQLHGKSPGRFKFTLRDDEETEFNHSWYIDMVKIGGKVVMHAVDSGTGFNSAVFVSEETSKAIWEALRYCVIDAYLGPPVWVVVDAAKALGSAEFKTYANSLGVGVKQVPVEAHNSVGKIERYHAPLRRAYNIISTELRGQEVSAANRLQMAVKAVNDTAGPNGLVPTLLVFGAYPRISDESPPTATITQRAEAIRKAMKEVREINARRQVRDALAMRNGPSTLETLNLPLQSEVKVWREKRGWTGPHILIAREEETCHVQVPYGIANFRTTVT